MSKLLKTVIKCMFIDSWKYIQKFWDNHGEDILFYGTAFGIIACVIVWKWKFITTVILLVLIILIVMLIYTLLDNVRTYIKCKIKQAKEEIDGTTENNQRILSELE